VRAKELRERSTQELRHLIEETKESLFQARIKNATHQLTDTSALRKARRELARIETVLSQRGDEAARKAGK
jgi:large subunit ribosomal protein L29